MLPRVFPPRRPVPGSSPGRSLTVFPLPSPKTLQRAPPGHVFCESPSPSVPASRFIWPDSLSSSHSSSVVFIRYGLGLLHAPGRASVVHPPMAFLPGAFKLTPRSHLRRLPFRFGSASPGLPGALPLLSFQGLVWSSAPKSSHPGRVASGQR